MSLDDNKDFIMDHEWSSLSPPALVLASFSTLTLLSTWSLLSLSPFHELYQLPPP